MEANPMTIGIVLLVINGGVQWIRELKRKGTKNDNGEALKAINDNIGECKEKMDCIDGKIGQTNVEMAGIKTAVDGQKEQCTKTVKRFDETIRDQNQSIIELAGRRKR